MFPPFTERESMHYMTPSGTVWRVRSRKEENSMSIWGALELESGIKVGKYGTITSLNLNLFLKFFLASASLSYASISILV